MKYMIHACPPRMWYVDNFLLPSMQAQGIAREDVTVWNDKAGAGNLKSFVQSMKLCGVLNDRGVWHLQDDVILSSSFAERTAELEQIRAEPVICGFGCNFGDGTVDFKDKTPVKFLWYSFPCVFISNMLACEFAEWFEQVAATSPGFRENLDSGKMDDWFFRSFMLARHQNDHVFHATPALVDHVDYLIGGSQVNQLRTRKINRAQYWEEPELVEKLVERLEKYKQRNPFL